MPLPKFPYGLLTGHSNEPAGTPLVIGFLVFVLLILYLNSKQNYPYRQLSREGKFRLVFCALLVFFFLLLIIPFSEGIFWFVCVVGIGYNWSHFKNRAGKPKGQVADGHLYGSIAALILAISYSLALLHDRFVQL